jgi:proteasome accessory factor B
MLRIIGLLQLGSGQNVDSLSIECGVSRRTVFRDLQMLRSAGLPLRYDEELQRYAIAGTHILPPTNFTAEEALSVIVLCRELGDAGRIPFYGPARSACIKLESSLPARLRQQLGDVTGAIQIRMQPTGALSGKKPYYEQLVDAIAGRRCVRMRYGSLTEWDEIGTKLSPYRLLFSRHSWYVIGRSSLHRATRTFNVGRIVQLEVLADRFKIPRQFSLDRYLGNAWHLIPESGPDQDVTVRFSPTVAQNVAEVSWHKTQRTEMNDDGTLDFHVTVSGIHEMSWWILGYGDHAEVLHPKSLRDLITGRAARMLKQYT